jgi:hypothetical protein
MFRIDGFKLLSKEEREKRAGGDGKVQLLLKRKK